MHAIVCFSKEYCVENVSGIFRRIYYYSTSKPLGEVCGEGSPEITVENVLIFNGTNIYFDLLDGVSIENQKNSSFKKEFLYVDETKKGAPKGIIVSKYKIAFTDAKYTGMGVDSSVISNCGEILVSISDSTTTYVGSSKPQYYADEFSYGDGWELDVFKDVSPVSWGEPNRDYYMHYSTDDFRGYDMLPYRFLKAFVGCCLHDKQDYVKSYLLKKICIPQTDMINTYYVGSKKRKMGYLNNNDVMYVVEIQKDYVLVEFYTSEYTTDKCLVKKNDVVFLNDLVNGKHQKSMK